MDTYEGIGVGYLRRCRRRWKDNIRIGFREVDYKVANLNNFSPIQGPVVVSCEHGNREKFCRRGFDPA